VDGVSSNGFDAIIVSPYPLSGGGNKSNGVGGGCGGIAFAFDVFRRFFGLLGADGMCCDCSDGDLKSGGHKPDCGIRYAIPKLWAIIFEIQTV
jgi:hypothetical protein